MRITVVAVGRLRGGPEHALVTDYFARFERLARQTGLDPVRIVEVEARRGTGPAAEAPLLLEAVPKGAVLAVLDERGQEPDSDAFAAMLRRSADAGTRDFAFLIGGADGLDVSVRENAAYVISFGRMVWPHLLVRVMLAEQLYRAASILAGTPYHRGG